MQHCVDLAKAHTTVCAAFTVDFGPPDAVSGRAATGTSLEQMRFGVCLVFATFYVRGQVRTLTSNICRASRLVPSPLARSRRADTNGYNGFTRRARGAEWRPREAVPTLSVEQLRATAAVEQDCA